MSSDDIQYYVLRLGTILVLAWAFRREFTRMWRRVLQRDRRAPATLTDRLDVARAWLVVVSYAAVGVLVVVLLVTGTLPTWLLVTLAAIALGSVCVGLILSLVMGLVEGWRAGDGGQGPHD